VKRRWFLALLGGMTMGLPTDGVAQQSARLRRIGVLIGFMAGDAEGLSRARTIAEELRDLGWRDNYSARIDYRWTSGDTEQIQALARELVSLGPEVLIADGTAQAVALLQATRTIPIVFLIASDPVGLGIVQSLARPGGNATVL